MLRHILIKNFALIEQLELDLFPEYTVITGETGAGKSIILGALDLVLGKRAQPKLIKDPNQKCVIEAHFDLYQYNLQQLFESQEVDYAELSIFRREILPSGKSRAFINDMPVALHQMETLSAYLIDIHAQHDTLNIQQSETVFNFIDGFADHLADIKNYQKLWLTYNENKKKLKKLSEERQQRNDEINYLQYQYDEIQQLAPKTGELEQLETEVKKQENAEQILQQFHQVYFSISESENNSLDQLRQSAQALSSIQKFDAKIEEINERLQSLNIELQDICNEIESLKDEFNLDPEALERNRQRLDLIHQCLQKHRLSSIDELLEKQENLEQQLLDLQLIDFNTEALAKEVAAMHKSLSEAATQITQNRKNTVPDYEKKVTRLLQQLGMPDAVFQVNLTTTEALHKYGNSEVEFLFSANKGVAPQALHKVASGGELSRIMLVLKSLYAEKATLPTLIFDEIDTGVSGNIAAAMADIIAKMAEKMQIICITHLPQVAASGKKHLIVYKESTAHKTQTLIKYLQPEERKLQIAAMLSAGKPEDTALKHAENLLLKY